MQILVKKKEKQAFRKLIQKYFIIRLPKHTLLTQIHACMNIDTFRYCILVNSVSWYSSNNVILHIYTDIFLNVQKYILWYRKEKKKTTISILRHLLVFTSICTKMLSLNVGEMRVIYILSFLWNLGVQIHFLLLFFKAASSLLLLIVILLLFQSMTSAKLQRRFRIRIPSAQSFSRSKLKYRKRFNLGNCKMLLMLLPLQ